MDTMHYETTPGNSLLSLDASTTAHICGILPGFLSTVTSLLVCAARSGGSGASVRRRAQGAVKEGFLRWRQPYSLVLCRREFETALLRLHSSSIDRLVEAFMNNESHAADSEASSSTGAKLHAAKEAQPRSGTRKRRGVTATRSLSPPRGDRQVPSSVPPVTSPTPALDTSTMRKASKSKEKESAFADLKKRSMAAASFDDLACAFKCLATLIFVQSYGSNEERKEELVVHGYPGGQWDLTDLMTVKFQCPLVGFQEIGTPLLLLYFGNRILRHAGAERYFDVLPATCERSGEDLAGDEDVRRTDRSQKRQLRPSKNQPWDYGATDVARAVMVKPAVRSSDSMPRLGPAGAFSGSTESRRRVTFSTNPACAHNSPLSPPLRACGSRSTRDCDTYCGKSANQ
ncbi:hypothetical protein C8R47DRAFT_1080013 [Mycena vitilis]|nr:hypothetical protein C8R47DRAFT_1080013 [Mycena vitilis]